MSETTEAGNNRPPPCQYVETIGWCPTGSQCDKDHVFVPRGDDSVVIKQQLDGLIGLVRTMFQSNKVIADKLDMMEERLSKIEKGVGKSEGALRDLGVPIPSVDPGSPAKTKFKKGPSRNLRERGKTAAEIMSTTKPTHTSIFKKDKDPFPDDKSDN